MPRILMIVGSLRKQSFNHQLAREIERIIGDRAEVTFLDWGDVPLMNQDIEWPAPEAVQRVRDAVLAADGLWFFSPEYNYQIPGGLRTSSTGSRAPSTSMTAPARPPSRASALPSAALADETPPPACARI